MYLIYESDRIVLEKSAPWKHSKYVKMIGQKSLLH